MKIEKKWRWVARLRDALGVSMVSVAMGSFVALAHFQDFGPPIALGVGETILSVSLGGGILLGLLFSKDEIPAIIAKSFAAWIGAYIFIFLTVFAPILVGVVSDLSFLGGGQLVRVALITPIFIFPLNLLGSMFGRLLGEWLKAFSKRPGRAGLSEE